MDAKAQSDKVEKVLNEILFEDEGGEEGDILVEWIVVAFVDNPQRDNSGYPMLFSNNSMPAYRARGLLHTGLIHLDPRFDDEE